MTRSALALSGYNTHALSAIRGIYAPDSAEYDQAGGTRSSERKTPVRGKAAPVKTVQPEGSIIKSENDFSGYFY